MRDRSIKSPELTDSLRREVSKGEIVTAHFYGGDSGPRRFLRFAHGGDVVVICAESEWQSAMAAQREPEGLGFPVCDISFREVDNAN
jgi:regulator of RNase E activity RraA